MRPTDDDRCDVYLVHDPSETALAEAIDHRLAEVGLRCRLHAGDVSPNEDFEETVHQMLDTSRSVAILLSSSAAINQVIAALAAAAWARDLPAFVLRNQVRASDYSSFFKQFPSFNLWSGFSRFVKAVGRVPERASA
jgi:hypothetical protein